MDSARAGLGQNRELCEMMHIRVYVLLVGLSGCCRLQGLAFAVSLELGAHDVHMDLPVHDAWRSQRSGGHWSIGIVVVHGLMCFKWDNYSIRSV